MPTASPINITTFDIGYNSGAPPGAATQYQFVVPANARYEILGLRYILTTDANVADRYHVLTATIGGNNHGVGAFTTAQTASSVWYVSWQSGLPENMDLTANNLATLGYSPGLILDAGDSFQTAALNLQAADAFTSITIAWKRWIIA